VILAGGFLTCGYILISHQISIREQQDVVDRSASTVTTVQIYTWAKYDCQYFNVVATLVWPEDPVGFADGRVATVRISWCPTDKRRWPSRKGILWSSRLAVRRETDITSCKNVWRETLKHSVAWDW